MVNCGCDPCHYLCPVAVALWAEVNAAYERWRVTRDEDDWTTYLKKKKGYEEHIDNATGNVV